MSSSKNAAGRHRKARQRATVVVSVPVAVSLACAGAAVAAPQPGVGVEESQPGVVSPGASQPGTAAPAPTREYVPFYTPIYPEAPSKPVYNYDYSQDENYSGGGVGYYSGPSQNSYDNGYSQSEVPAATPVTPDVVTVVEAPAKKFRAGTYIADQTDLLPEKQWNQLNATLADVEAGYGAVWKAAGVEASQAERIAAASIGSGAIGLASGAAAGAVPGALIGGTIGGITGAGLGTMVPLPFPLPEITSGVAGTAIGAAAGGVIGGAIGGTVGLASGAVTGAVFGAGEEPEAPIEFELPSKFRPDEAAITAQTSAAVAQAESVPGGASVVESVRVAVEQAPQQAAQADQVVRSVVSAQPGGSEAVASFDAFVAEAAPWGGVVNDPIAAAVAAASGALTA